jgi:hypothetical protein
MFPALGVLSACLLWTPARYTSELANVVCAHRICPTAIDEERNARRLVLPIDPPDALRFHREHA